VLRDFETLWGARALLTYFQAVADRSALPLVLSDHGGQLSDEIVVELAGHPKILGYVCGSDDGGKIEAIKTRTVQIRREVTVTPVFAAVTGRMQSRREDVEAKEMILASALSDGSTAMSVASPRVSTKTRTKVVGFQILAGRTSSMLKGLLDGAVGALPPFGAAAPQACYEVLAAWKDGDQGLAQEKQERVQGVAARIEAQMGIAGIKFGCDLNGYFGGVPRLPLLPLSGEERSEIEVLMQGMRN
jgi:4-hydroxy-2-oxoglutarate aldolase